MDCNINGLIPLPGFSDGHLFIAGPCSAESPEQVASTAQELARGGIKVFRAGVWKPRTMPGTFEGIGEAALPWLYEVKQSTSMLTATEVATATHVKQALGHGIDYLWLGARTVANPFAVQEIADAIAASGKSPAVLVKNPLSPDIDLWIGALRRLYDAGVRCLGAVHRGFTCYAPGSPYRNEPHWSVAFELRRRLPSLPLLCDPSHIAGRRDLVPEVAFKAMEMGFDGLIIESHCNPDKALSDAQQQLTPAALLEMLAGLRHRAINLTHESTELEDMRRQLDIVDDEITEMLARRMEISRRIGRYKKSQGMTAVQPIRYTAMFESRVSAGKSKGLGSEFLRHLWSGIHAESVRNQIDEMSDPT